LRMLSITCTHNFNFADSAQSLAKQIQPIIVISSLGKSTNPW
jgi:hypothetical protein